MKRFHHQSRTVFSRSRFSIRQQSGKSAKRFVWVWAVVSALGVAGIPAATLRAEPGEPVGTAQATDQMRGSIGRLQSLEDTSYRDIRRDPERDREIQRLLPNFQVTGIGSSERHLRDQAIKTLQGVQLTQSGRQSADQVLGSLSIYRRLPEIRFEVDPDTYDHFIGNPDVVVSLWQAMGISAINLQQVRQYHYRMNNVDGTASELYYLHRHRNVNVIYCDGEFKSPLLKNTILAKGVFCLYSKFETDPDGTTFVRHHADVFVSMPNAAVETAAKLISPVSNYIADRNFQEISLFAHTMSLTMARQPGWVQEQSVRMRGLQPAQVQEFQQVTLRNYQAAQARFARRMDLEPLPIR